MRIGMWVGAEAKAYFTNTRPGKDRFTTNTAAYCADSAQECGILLPPDMLGNIL